MDLHIIIPKGRLEVVERDLMMLAAVISHLGLGKDAGGGMYEYGAQFNCEVFMMNPFCWCGRQDCPWCCSCTCPETALHYYIDGVDVGYEAYHRFEEEELAKCHTKEERSRKTKELRKRMQIVLEPVCDFCTTGLFPEYGTEPGRPAPNFWYKPTNLKIWWYKYIGRDMEYNRKFRMSEWQNIFRHCLEAVVEAADRRALERCEAASGDLGRDIYGRSRGD